MSNNSTSFVLKVGVLLSVLIGAVSSFALLTPGFYSAETPNWQAQSIAQDMVDLFIIVPGLLISTLAIYRGYLKMLPVWGGIMFYIAYTFTLYCFDVHFNVLFMVYCICLGLSFFSLLFFLFSISLKIAPGRSENLKPSRLSGVYSMTVAVLFYGLWLSDIIPSQVKGILPKSLAESGLFTNGVEVLDLSVVLPAIFINGLWLWQGKTVGHLLAPMIYSFFVLMDITIGFLTVYMNSKGVGGDWGIAVIMGILAAISGLLLIHHLKSGQPQ